MFSKDKLDHMKSFLEKADDLEKPKPRRYIPGVLYSIGLSAVTFGGLNSIALLIGLKEIPYRTIAMIVLIAIFIIGLILIGVSIYAEICRKEKYYSFTNEALLLIKCEQERQNAIRDRQCTS